MTSRAPVLVLEALGAALVADIVPVGPDFVPVVSVSWAHASAETGERLGSNEKRPIARACDRHSFMMN
jgi:hypothetical protein